MNFSNFRLNNKFIYWGLIITFFALYVCVGFVSTLHSITFFNLANTYGLAVLLGVTYELGQSAVLFSILMTKNKDKLLPWALMILLTALQVTANVYASFKFMVKSGTDDWTYWQKSILIGVQAENAEMYQVIISWISGALLPLVALGMTALVAENIKMMSENSEQVEKDSETPQQQTNQEDEERRIEEIIENEVKKRLEKTEEVNIDKIKEEYDKLDSSNFTRGLETKSEVIQEPIIIDLSKKPLNALDDEIAVIPKHVELVDQVQQEERTEQPIVEEVKEEPRKVKKPRSAVKKPKKTEVKEPRNKIPRWHLMKEFVDEDHNVFVKGMYSHTDPLKEPTPKKV